MKRKFTNVLIEEILLIPNGSQYRPKMAGSSRVARFGPHHASIDTRDQLELSPEMISILARGLRAVFLATMCMYLAITRRTHGSIKEGAREPPFRSKTAIEVYLGNFSYCGTVRAQYSFGRDIAGRTPSP